VWPTYQELAAASLSRRFVMRKPEMTKKTRTPRSPRAMYWMIPRGRKKPAVPSR